MKTRILVAGILGITWALVLIALAATKGILLAQVSPNFETFSSASGTAWMQVNDSAFEDSIDNGLWAVEPNNNNEGISQIYLPAYLGNVNLVFFDDFSDPASGWSVAVEDYGTLGYQDDEYEIQVFNGSGWIGVTSPPLDRIDNYSVEADMRRSSGSGSYGLIFGLIDWEHYYNFVVEPESQSYSVLRYNSDWITIIESTYSPHINIDNATNHLKTDRSGNLITVYVNGHLLATANDSTYIGDLKVGLFAEEYSTGPIAVRIDNFEVNHIVTTTAENR